MLLFTYKPKKEKKPKKPKPQTKKQPKKKQAVHTQQTLGHETLSSSARWGQWLAGFCKENYVSAEDWSNHH